MSEIKVNLLEKRVLEIYITADEEYMIVANNGDFFANGRGTLEIWNIKNKFMQDELAPEA
jgi:hypothetical protein